MTFRDKLRGMNPLKRGQSDDSVSKKRASRLRALVNKRQQQLGVRSGLVGEGRREDPMDELYMLDSVQDASDNDERGLLPCDPVHDMDNDPVELAGEATINDIDADIEDELDAVDDVLDGL